MDALVALTILATIIALGFEALISTRKVATAAEETQRANVVLRFLIEHEPSTQSIRSGRAAGFDWRAQTTLLPSAPGAPELTLCRQWAGVTGIRSRRSYTLSRLGFCAPPEAAP